MLGDNPSLLILEWLRLNREGDYPNAAGVAGRLLASAGADESLRQYATALMATAENNHRLLREAEAARARSGERGEAAAGWIVEGEACLELDLFERAARCFEQATSSDAALAAAWTGLGRARAELEPPLPAAEVMSCFDRAVQLAPESADAWFHRGLALSQFKRHREAMHCFDHLTQNLDPQSAWGWYARGLTLEVLGEHDAAIKSYAEALRRDPDAESAWSCHAIRLMTPARPSTPVE